MTASKARNGKKKAPPRKKSAPRHAIDEDTEPKVVTFRLYPEHRNALTQYAIDLMTQQKAQQMAPRHISNNEAVKHMIIHAKLPEVPKVESKPVEAAQSPS